MSPLIPINATVKTINIVDPNGKIKLKGENDSVTVDIKQTAGGLYQIHVSPTGRGRPGKIELDFVLEGNDNVKATLTIRIDP